MGRKGDGKQKRLPRSSKATFATVEPPDYDDSTPKFCLHHLQNGFQVSDLDKDKQSDFALALEKRRSMTWQELMTAPHLGLGFELMPKGEIIPPIPTFFQDAKRFHVFRYCGKLPMAGVRVNDVFHIVWIEGKFGDLYDHGP
jgi:hypothetical protein